MSEERFVEFKSELSKNIKAEIRALRADGTVSMSERNLLQCVVTPRNVAGPTGTNAAWVYASMFREAIMTLPRGYRVFVDRQYAEGRAR